MSLRIYWRTGPTRRCVAELVIVGAVAWSVPAMAASDPKADSAPAAAERVTARDAIERQFAAEASRAGTMSAAEAARIMEKYHARIGKMLEPKRETGTGR